MSIHHPVLWTILCSLSLCLGRTEAHADMFDNARRAIRTEVSRRDQTGVSVRGGVNLQTGVAPSSTTLLRGQVTTGGGCGAFDFATSLKESFDALPEAMENIGTQVLNNLPLLVLCYSSPTLCDAYKHLQALSNVIVQAKYATCQQTQNALMYAGSRLRGGEESRCLSDQVAAGVGIARAMRTCGGDTGLLHAPDGTRRAQVNLVEETLASAGASVETQKLAKGLLGEVTIRAQGSGLSRAYEHPQAALLARYETHRAEADTAIRAAVEEFRTTGTLSEATLRAISVPGQAVPLGVIQALAALQPDQPRYESLTGKLGTGLAITQLAWDCHEVAEQLAASAEANGELTDSQKALLEKQLEGLQRNLAMVLQKKEIVERHLQPALDALLSEYAAVQQAAAQAGVRAPTSATPPMPFRHQMPSGYSQ